MRRAKPTKCSRDQGNGACMTCHHVTNIAKWNVSTATCEKEDQLRVCTDMARNKQRATDGELQDQSPFSTVKTSNHRGGHDGGSGYDRGGKWHLASG